MNRESLLSLGTCFGKFTKSGKFRLHITALDYVSQYAKVSKPASKYITPRDAAAALRTASNSQLPCRRLSR